MHWIPFFRKLRQIKLRQIKSGANNQNILYFLLSFFFISRIYHLNFYTNDAKVQLEKMSA
jgi:hypothetical protein